MSGDPQQDSTASPGLATAGLVIGIVITAVVVLYLVLLIVAFGILAMYTS